MYIFQYISAGYEFLPIPHGICAFIMVMSHKSVIDTLLNWLV